MADLTLPMTPLVAPMTPTVMGSESDAGSRSDSPGFHAVADAAVEALRSARSRTAERNLQRNAARHDRDARSERRPQRPAAHRSEQTSRPQKPVTAKPSMKADSKADSKASATDKAADDATKDASATTTDAATPSTTSTGSATTLSDAATAAAAANSAATVSAPSSDAAAALLAATAADAATAATAIDTAIGTDAAVTTGADALASTATVPDAATPTATPATPGATNAGGSATTTATPLTVDNATKGPARSIKDAQGDDAAPHAQSPDAATERVPQGATPVLIAPNTPAAPGQVATTNPAAVTALTVQGASNANANATTPTAATVGGAHIDAAEQVEANSNAMRIVSGARFLRRSVDGPSSLTVTLEPAHLGQVRIDMTLQDGALSVRLTAQHSAGAMSLQKALPALHSELEADGLHLADLGVGLGTSNGRGADGDRSTASDARRGVDHDSGALNGTTAGRGRRGVAVNPLTTPRRAHLAGRFDLDL